VVITVRNSPDHAWLHRARDSWPKVPREVAGRLRESLTPLVDEMVTEIQARVPEYARPGDADYARTVRLGVELAVIQFADRVAAPESDWDQVVDVFTRIGRIESAEGRGLDALQSALRVGAQVLLRRLTEESWRFGTPAETLGLVGEALLVFLDEIAAVTASGYSMAREQVAGEVMRRRRRLLSLLLSEPAVAEQAIVELAHLSRWRLPSQVAVVILDEDSRPPALAEDVLVDIDRAQPWLIVPDPDGPGRREMMDRGLADLVAVIGPSVPLHAASQSLRWAQDALELARRGVFGSDSVIHCDDHLIELLLHHDEDLLRRLADRRLAPLADLPPLRRDPLAQTLLAWLQLGRIPAVADILHVHPQTVRYRLRVLRTRFGEQLDDPRRRFELELALTGRQRQL
jgi:PucR C-terminal helix-turn-helix domain